MMDDSDGIALSLYDLMSVNACGFSIDPEKLPLHRAFLSCRTGNWRCTAATALIFTLPGTVTRTWRALQSDRESRTGEGGACGGKTGGETRGSSTGGREPAPRQVPAHFS